MMANNVFVKIRKGTVKTMIAWFITLLAASPVSAQTTYSLQQLKDSALSHKRLMGTLQPFRSQSLQLYSQRHQKDTHRQCFRCFPLHKGCLCSQQHPKVFCQSFPRVLSYKQCAYL